MILSVTPVACGSAQRLGGERVWPGALERPDTAVADPIVSRALMLGSIRLTAPIEVLTPEEFIAKYAPRADKATQMSHLQEYRRLAAMVVQGQHKVFVFRGSETYRNASRGDSFALYVLASAVHHELRHLHGDDECAAYNAQMQFIESFIAKGLIDKKRGEQYVQHLADVRDSVAPHGGRKCRAGSF